MNMKMSALVTAVALSGMQAQAMFQDAPGRAILALSGAALLAGAGAGARALGSQSGAQQGAAVGLHDKATSEGAGKSKKDSKKPSKAISEAEHKEAAAEQVSPRTQNRRLLSQVNVRRFKAEEDDVAALEAFIQQAQRTACQLRSEVEKEKMKKELGLSVQDAERAAKEAAEERASRERIAAERLRHEAREAKAKREHDAQLQAEKLKADATLVASFVKEVPTLLRALRDHQVLSTQATPATVAPLALPAAPAVSPAAQSGTTETQTPVSVTGSGSTVAAHVQKIEQETKKD